MVLKKIFGVFCAVTALAGVVGTLQHPNRETALGTLFFGAVAYWCLRGPKKQTQTLSQAPARPIQAAPTDHGNQKTTNRKTPGVDLEDEQRRVWSMAFQKVFNSEVKRLGVFSDEDIERMIRTVLDAKIEARRQWYQSLFENYFQGREWKWREYERWKKKFAEADLWPERWGLADPDEKKLSHAFFDYIYPKSESMEAKTRWKGIGFKKAFLIIDGENTRYWVEKCLEKKPTAMPPYFPGDQTLVNGFIPEMSNVPPDTIIIPL